MGKVYTPTPITNIETSESALNQNFADIEAALEDVLSRNGAAPNQMEDHLDLNSFDAVNIGNLGAETVRATTIIADNVVPGAPTVGPLLVIERKSGRFDNTANTFPKILGFSGAAVAQGNTQLLSGGGILVPAGVGALALTVRARCLANQNLITVDPDVASVAGFSRTTPTENSTAGSAATEGILTIDPIVGAPIAFSRPANPVFIATSFSGNTVSQYLYELGATSYYCPVQQGDTLIPFVHFEGVTGNGSPTNLNDYDLELEITVVPIDVTPTAAQSVVKPILPFAGIHEANT